MKLRWNSTEYVLNMDSVRESQLIRDLLIEADYALHRLSDAEYKLRIGTDRKSLQREIDCWQLHELTVHLSITRVEIVRACWSEALDFFSDTDFHLRTGWGRIEAEALLRTFMKARRALTIKRQWG